MEARRSRMNARERYVETLTFGTPDKVPFRPGWPRESTLRAWRTQGLPDGADWRDVLCAELGIEWELPKEALSPGVSFRMMPQFDEKVLEHRDGHYVVQDWMGAITEISDEYDLTYLREARDFVTRKWHKFPVESRADWARMKARFDPATPGRFPDDFDARCERLRARDYPVGVNFAGPFWQMREWLGFEGLCMKMIEDPALIREMAEFWAAFVMQVLQPILDRGILDEVGFSEDMAYKTRSMISPAMAREFLLPAWRQWTETIRAAGVPIVWMDSDGDVGELIPLWIEAGMNVCTPMEVAAGNDLVELRRRFGRQMAYVGGLDKRALAKGGGAMRAELERVVPPLLNDGGFIPGCDHGVPPDVSWPSFVEYARLLAEMTGWL
jgi:hypothetical protein